MKELVVNIAIFGPYVRDLYDKHLILGFGAKSVDRGDHKRQGASIRYVVSDETASMLLMKLPPRAIVSTTHVDTVDEFDRFMVKMATQLHQQEEEMPEEILDFTE